MENIVNVVGAGVLSLFVVANIFAMYLYLKRHLSLAPGSEMNHAITSRFDSQAEINAYHDQADAETHAGANAALGNYQQIFQHERALIDPQRAALYPTPSKQFSELI